MNKKIVVLFKVLILCFSISTANAGILGVMKQHPILSGIGIAGGALYSQTAIHKARDLSYHLPKVESYFKLNPQDFNPISQYVLYALKNPNNKKDYDRYKRLAETMGLDDIPPYINTANNEPTILVNPIQEENPADNILANPIQTETYQNIIYTPTGEAFDTIPEFPNQQIESWEDYLIVKRQSDILAENMRLGGMGSRPKGYAAHHIVAWDDNRYSVCQDLRDLLNNNGIGINDSENGVYLPARKITKNPNEAYHPEIHTKEYYKNIYDELEVYNNNTQGLKNALKDIGQRLKNNQFKY